MTIPALKYRPSAVDFHVLNVLPCRIDNLELQLQFEGSTAGKTAHLHHRDIGAGAQIFNPTTDPLSAGVLTGKQLPQLNIFEGFPVIGRWRLETEIEVSEAFMLVNQETQDPREVALACESGVDQSENIREVCSISEHDSLSAAIEGEDDVDLFFIDGPLDGTFIPGQLINITVETQEETTLDVDIMPLGASLSLDHAVQTAQGTYELSTLIPPAYYGRYMVLKITRAEQGDEPVDYSVELSFSSSQP
jgi:hypothetical protein